jgi:virginiamycin B lyase
MENSTRLFIKIMKSLLFFLLLPSLCYSQEVTDINEVATATLQVKGYSDWIEIGKRAVWISNSGLNLLQRIDLKSNRIIAGVTVNEPCAAFTIGFGSVWVASCGDKAIIRISEKSNEIIAKIPLTIGNDEGSIVADKHGVWVLSDAKGILTRIDPTNNKVVAQIAVKENSFAAMAGFGSIWITNTVDVSTKEQGSVQRIDPKTNTVVATIPVGIQPRFLAVGEGGVWTLNQVDGSVSRIDPASNKVVATIECNAPGTGGDISAGEGFVWVRIKQQLMLVIDPNSNKVIKKFGPPAGSGAVRAGHGAVWITAHDINKVWMLHPKVIKESN